MELSKAPLLCFCIVNITVQVAGTHIVHNTEEVQSNLVDNYSGSVSCLLIFASSFLTEATVRWMVDAAIIRGIIHQM